MEAHLIELQVEVMQLLDARELYRFFHAGDEEVMALRGVSFAIGEGEMIALVGPSGSGKSTLLMCLAGLDEPDGGTVWLKGHILSRRPEMEKTRLRAKYLGLMRQRDNLFPHLTVLENVQIARVLAGDREGTDKTDVLDRMGMGARQSALPAQLSGGEQARAGIAVAMACRPQILLLDEPTGETDADTEKTILSLLADFRKDGGAVVVATHNHLVGRMATRAATMEDGRIVDG
jgi:putative ABC transport system ATP-binding protein